MNETKVLTNDDWLKDVELYEKGSYYLLFKANLVDNLIFFLLKIHQYPDLQKHGYLVVYPNSDLARKLFGENIAAVVKNEKLTNIWKDENSYDNRLNILTEDEQDYWIDRLLDDDDEKFFNDIEKESTEKQEAIDILLTEAIAPDVPHLGWDFTQRFLEGKNLNK